MENNNINLENASYLDLLTKLKKDVESDQSMPKEIRKSIVEQIVVLFTDLYPYSY